MVVEDVVGFGFGCGFDISIVKVWFKQNVEWCLQVKGFFDKCIWSVQYVVFDFVIGKCVIIDLVLDFDEKVGVIGIINVDVIFDYVWQNGLIVEWIFDIYLYVDYFFVVYYFKEKIGVRIVIGGCVVDVQKFWKRIYNWFEFVIDGLQWDYFFVYGEMFKVGFIDVKVMFLFGYMFVLIIYVVGDVVFVYDMFFMFESGMVWVDFFGGDVCVLWKLIQDIFVFLDDI